jgi:hypothetical protein
MANVVAKYALMTKVIVIGAVIEIARAMVMVIAIVVANSDSRGY